MSALPPPVDVLGVGVHPVTRAQVHEHILRCLEEERQIVVPNLNAHAANLMFSVPWFRDFLRQGDVLVCDSAGVRLAARILGGDLPETFAFLPWLPELGRALGSAGRSLFFLGGKPGVAAQAAAVLREQVPEIRIAGTRHGYFERSGQENDAVVAEVNAAGADVLVVGLGMPIQERWIRDNRDRLEVGCLLPGGGCFDWVAGVHPAPPAWMPPLGLEWLYRLYLEPSRLARRYLIGNPLFLARVLRQRVLGATDG